MKNFLLTSVFLGSLSTFATVDLTCKSAKYTLTVHDLGSEKPSANYAIDGKFNEGADVEVGPVYFSDRVIALSLSVDAVIEKFEIAVTSTKPKNYKGLLFTGNQSQVVTCKLN